MCGGRGDDDDVGAAAMKDGGVRGHGDVLAGAGRSGGGEERPGNPSVGAADMSASFSSSVSMATGSGASVVPSWCLVTRMMGGGVEVETFPVCLDFTGCELLRSSGDAALDSCRGLCCSTDLQDDEEAEDDEEGEAGGASFSIMTVKSSQ